MRGALRGDWLTTRPLYECRVCCICTFVILLILELLINSLLGRICAVVGEEEEVAFDALMARITVGACAPPMQHALLREAMGAVPLLAKAFASAMKALQVSAQ